MEREAAHVSLGEGFRRGHWTDPLDGEGLGSKRAPDEELGDPEKSMPLETLPRAVADEISTASELEFEPLRVVQYLLPILRSILALALQMFHQQPPGSYGLAVNTCRKHSNRHG